VRAVAGQGTSVIYISHRLREIESIADRVSVLRDGERVVTARAAELGREALLEAMLGRALSPSARPTAKHAGAPRLTVSALSTPPLRAASFDVLRGEIVGIAGATGSGASALLRALAGDAVLVAGSAELDGRPYAPASPRDALARGVLLLAADRHESVLPNLGVRDNALLAASLRGTFGPIHREAERAALAPEVARLRLKAGSLEARAESLSGGNQQKVALLRCLMARPRLLLLDDPSRGVDLGAKADLFARLHEAAAEGTSTLFFSSDLSELTEHADRVLALFRGVPVATLTRPELTTERLLSLIMGAQA
jgi:ABC-type sugar transport system ATPase subunit